MMIEQTQTFSQWLHALKDRQARARILRRIERLALGHQGDFKALGGKLFELREHYGAGYRIYYTERQGQIIVLLVGGHKNSQERDIKTARAMIEDITRGTS